MGLESNQSTNQSINQSTNQSSNQSTNQSSKQSRNESSNQGSNEITNESSNQESNQITKESRGPTATVEHVYRMFSTHVKDILRNGGSLVINEYSLSIMKDIAHEMKTKIQSMTEDANEDENNDEQNTVQFDPLCNIYFYCVTSLPLKMQSQMYFFANYSATSNQSTIESSIQDTNTPCVLIIDNSHVGSYEALEAASKLQQTITDLYIKDLKIEAINEDAIQNEMLRSLQAALNIEEPDLDRGDLFKWPDQLFQIDPDAKSVQIFGEKCNFPRKVQIDLGQQLASCTQLQSLRIPGQPLLAREIVLNLGQKTELKHLDLSLCHSEKAHRKVFPMTGFPSLQGFPPTQGIPNFPGIPTPQPFPLLNPSDFATPMSMEAAFGSGNPFGRPRGVQPDCDATALCGLSEEKCSILGRELQHLVHLRVLNLSNIPLKVEGTRHLAESIGSWGRNPPLQELKLGDCQMQESGTLAEALASCKKLKVLNLNNNDMSSAGVKLGQAMKSWRGQEQKSEKLPLEDLRLNGCGIKECEEIMEALEFCSGIHHLDLSHNHLGTDGSRCLARSVSSWGKDNSLGLVSLNSCELDPQGSTELLRALASAGLHTLDISGNWNAGGSGFQGLRRLPVFLRLTWLELNNTALTELDVQVLGDIIRSGGLPRLYSFAACGCGITSSGAAHLMAALTSCDDLNTLYLSINPIGGAFTELQMHENLIGEDVNESTNPDADSQIETPFPVYRKLRHLWLKDTSLQSGDFPVIASMVTQMRMPRLITIVIGWNKLANEAAAMKERKQSKVMDTLRGAIQHGSGTLLQEMFGLVENPADTVDYQTLLAGETDETLEALATIAQNVNTAVVMDGGLDINKEQLLQLLNTERFIRQNLHENTAATTENTAATTENTAATTENTAATTENTAATTENTAATTENTAATIENTAATTENTAATTENTAATTENTAATTENTAATTTTTTSCAAATTTAVAQADPERQQLSEEGLDLD